jgi:alkanesulfonate monooxygenase SsuD/methylene tetrahydromethanopterin reductase-like flavin-dependent oxidoreductase (luciferase family)
MSIEMLTEAGPFHWGVMLAQGWKGELAATGREKSWVVARDWASHAEFLGFHGVWVFDHFQAYPARDDSPVLEAWTTLAALSQVTERAVIGTLVSCAGYRNPAVTVKMAENLHVLSAGRFCLGLGAGWDRPEFESLDIPFGSASERSDRLEAVLRACHAAWRGLGAGGFVLASGANAVLASGAHVDGRRRPLLLVGGEGERRTLPAAAAYADAVNWQVGLEEFARKSRVLADLCDAAGRDPGSVRRTQAPNFQLFDSENEFARWRQHEDRGMSSEEVYAYIRNRGALYGTSATIEATIEEFIDAGCGGFMVFCNSAPALQGLEQLASLAPVRRALNGEADGADGRWLSSLIEDEPRAGQAVEER